MTKNIAEILVDRLNENDYESSIIKDYSGRGMYGKTTYAVVTPANHTQLMVITMEVVYDMGASEDIVGKDEPVDAIKQLQNDTLGREDLVYY